MRYLHTMLRVRDLDAALDFYCNKLGLKETRRRVDEKNRYTLVFLAGPDDEHLVESSKKSGRPGPEGSGMKLRGSRTYVRYTNVALLAGGLDGWIRAGGEVGPGCTVMGIGGHRAHRQYHAGLGQRHL